MAYPGARWYTWRAIVPETKMNGPKELNVCGKKFGQEHKTKKNIAAGNEKMGNIAIKNSIKPRTEYPKSAILFYKQSDCPGSREGKPFQIRTTGDKIKEHSRIVSFRHSATPRLEGTPKLPEEFDFTRSKTLDK